MSYDDAVAYLLSFADFERSGRFMDRPDVAPMRALLQALVDPQEGRMTVHVARTKGKGSVSAKARSSSTMRPAIFSRAVRSSSSDAISR